MNKRSGLILPLFVSILVLAPPYAGMEGCGISYRPDEYRIAWFNPLVIQQTPLAPFHYCASLLNTETADPEQQDYRRNCREWAAYFRGSAKEADVLKVLYHAGSATFLTEYDANNLKEAFPGNTFIAELSKKGREEAMAYLLLAFRAEFAHFASDDPWELGESVLDKEKQLSEIVKAAKSKLKTVRDPFLVKRYAYQVLVQQRYLGNYRDCIAIFDKYFKKDRADSILKTWATLYKAEAHEQLGEHAQGTYWFSRAFDMGESKKIRSYKLFNPKYADNAFALAANAHEKAVLLTLQALHNPGRSMSTLREIVALDPNLSFLPLLITREINKLEDWLLTPRITFFESWMNETGAEVALEDILPREEVTLNQVDAYTLKNQLKDEQYLREFLKFLDGFLAGKTGSAHTDFLNLALAHLYQMNGQSEAALRHLDLISNGAAPVVRLQQHLEKLLLLPASKDIAQASVKEEILASLEAIAGQTDLLEQNIRLYPKLLLHFSRLFHQKGDIVSAGLLYNRSLAIPTNAYTGSTYYFSIGYFDRYASLADMDQLIALAGRTRKSGWENFLTAPLTDKECPRVREDWSYWFYGDACSFLLEELETTYPVPEINKLYDLKGVIAFRQDKLEEALKAFNQLPDNYWETTYEFQTYLNHDPVAKAFLSGQPSQEVKSDKKAIVRKMLDLRQKLDKAGKDAASNHLSLANAYFNTTYWGNSWMMFSYGKSSEELSPWGKIYLGNYIFYPNTEKYYDRYYGLDKAVEHYQAVLDNKPDPELAAQATYMLALCDDLRRQASTIKERVDFMEDEQEEYFSPIYTEWYNRYRTTDFYREQMASCPMLEDYIRKNRRR